jgi:hypothetical protein
VELKIDYRDINILCISDMHIPYHHPDSLKFLAALKSLYDPDLVVCLGDLVDFHAISFHESDPELMSAGDELRHARSYCQILESGFEDMIIIGSNHGDLPLRKFMSHGLPRSLIRSYNEIFGVGDGWKFVDNLTIESHSKYLPDIHFTHGIKKNGIQLAQQRGQRVVQGHYHTEMYVKYAGNPNSLLWAVGSGCLIDSKSLAFAYDKLHLNRPILGTSVIERGIPTVIPMILDKSGRWIEEIV